jgi:hypothetical protein
MAAILQYSECCLRAIWPHRRPQGGCYDVGANNRCDRPHSRTPVTHKTLLLDGGTGRELLRLGAPFRQPEWSALALMEGPRFVSEVHQRYIAAGADVITTNSYAVVPFHVGAARFAREGA